MKHLLSLETMPREDLELVLRNAAAFKSRRGHDDRQPLAGQTWAMIFSKSSTRTRVSFEVGIHEMGGRPLFLNANDIQLGRGEPIKDTARVLGRMVHGAVIRTFAQSDVEDFAKFSGIPTVNALTDDEHPCQILTDIFTFQELRGSIAGKVVTFVGDGACNVPQSWIFAAAKLGFELRIAAPKAFQPSADVLKRAGGRVTCTEDIRAAAAGADLLYTDVWVSMGEADDVWKQRIDQLLPFQVNTALMKATGKPRTRFMHCLPAFHNLDTEVGRQVHERYGLKEIEVTDEVFESDASIVFTQAENRLHTIKAVLVATLA